MPYVKKCKGNELEKLYPADIMDTPVPIANTEVKPLRADDTMIAKVIGK